MRSLLLLCSVLAGCGGGGGSSDDPDPPDPPTCCASTAQISGRVATLFSAVLDAYDTRVQNTEQSYAANGQFGLAAHFQAFVQDATDTAQGFADDGNPDNGVNSIHEIVDDTAPPYDGAALDDLAEDYRADLLAYILEHFDNLQSRANYSNAAQYRQQVIDNVNAVFAQLKADI